jgi:hypothetical protein
VDLSRADPRAIVRRGLPETWRHPWRHLPRDSRDTLFLLVVIGWTVLPHVPNLPAWCVAFSALLLLWRAHLALTSSPLPPRSWLVVALLAAGALTWWSHRTLLGKEAGITLAVVLMGLKTLELRARRDAFVVFFLGLFVVLTHFLFNQSLLTAVAMLLSVWGLMTALVLAHMPAGRPSLPQAGRQAARAALLGAPIMALLFVLFPRIGPLWGVPQEAAAKTGLSGTMELGAMAQIANDDSVAMRVRFLEGPRPAPQELYFRGPVLSRFDGREWSAAPGGVLAEDEGELQVQGPALRYEITMEPSRLPLLPLLEATAEAPVSDGGDGDGDGPTALRPTQRRDLTWQVNRPLLDRTRWIATAHPRFRQGPTHLVRGMQRYLELPLGHNPRTLQWADSLRDDPRYRDADARTLVRAVLAHIATGGFSYTLAPGVYGETDPRGLVDEFWLDRKQGFCEHFAAAFVVVMRALDVPARVVTGYQGADPLVVDGYYIVRQSHAHAWAEYWQEGLGWVRADPTAAVAPDRVQASRYLPPQRGLVANAIGSFSPDLLAQLRGGWEAVNNRWNQWVLNYSRGQQLNLLRQLGMLDPHWEDLTLLLLGTLSSLALAAAGWAWWDRRRQDPWTRLNGHIRRRLHKHGIQAPVHASLRELASRVAAREGGATLADWLLALDTKRYGRNAITRPPRAAVREFERRMRQLRAG